jgi:uncharacterized protein YcnI
MPRKLVFAGIVAALVVGWAVPAWAHVTVAPESAPKSTTNVQVTFRVPNEETSAATTKVQIVFPTDPPLVGVLAQPVTGWKANVTTQHLSTPIQTDDGPVSDVVSQVTWTADNTASGVQPNDFQGFQVLVGALPDSGSQVVFKAVQTYSDGTVVRWVDPVTPGGPAAEHPTPILTLTAGSTSANGGETSTTVATGGSATGAVKTAKDNADTAKTIGIIALIVSVLALIGVVVVFAMRRKPASS